MDTNFVPPTFEYQKIKNLKPTKHETMKQHNKYSYTAKNNGKDIIYTTRLRLINQLNIDTNKSGRIYTYYLEAYLGVIIL